MPDQSTIAPTVYKDVPGFPGYRVGDDGSMWTCWGTTFDPSNGRVTGHAVGTTYRRLSTKARGNGYLWVALHSSKRRIHKLIHHIVLEAFVGPRQPGTEGCHYPDPTRTNNRLSNLRWDTRKGNAEDCVRQGRTYKGSAHHLSKLTEVDIPEIRRLHREGKKAYSIGKLYGVHRNSIYPILHGKTWKHVP